MPSEPVFLEYFDNLKTSLESMSTAHGEHYNYGPVEEDRSAGLDSAQESNEPPIYVSWQGEVEQDAIHGGETAAKRFRHHERVLVEIPVNDKERSQHSRRAVRIAADVHAVLIGTGTQRGRGSDGRATTYYASHEYAGNEDGGVLRLVYVIRWDHVMGDMATEG